jgi:hypothetical protein
MNTPKEKVKERLRLHLETGPLPAVLMGLESARRADEEAEPLPHAVNPPRYRLGGSN